MKYILTYKVYENFVPPFLYRNTTVEWLMDLLKNDGAQAGPKKYISFSKNPGSGYHDYFGDVRIVFNSEELYDQGAKNIEYNEDFFDKNPEICYYITGYIGEDDFYERKDDDSEEDWKHEILKYKPEDEVLLKKFNYKNGMIDVVYIPKKYKKEIEYLISKGINIHQTYKSETPKNI